VEVVEAFNIATPPALLPFTPHNQRSLNHLPLFRIKSELLTSDLANQCCIPGDELVAFDGQRLTVDNVRHFLAGDDLVGSTVDLVVRKHGTGVQVYVPLKRGHGSGNPDSTQTGSAGTMRRQNAGVFSRTTP
jgi:hypothetical protein